MIDVFKSSDGKKAIVAIYPDSEISLSETGDVKLIIGSEQGITDLRIALNSDRDGWTREAVKSVAFEKNAPLSAEQKAAIVALSDKGRSIAQIVAELGLQAQKNRVAGVVGGHKTPRFVKTKLPEPIDYVAIDKIIAEGRRDHKDYVYIADRINREAGGHWLPNDVAKRIQESKP
jgi:hypothetical protein